LEERNIIKDTKVAPAIQSAKVELEKARLEDELSQKLAARPDPSSLIKERILYGMTLLNCALSAFKGIV